MKRCEICRSRMWGDATDRYCYRCTPVREKLIAELGEETTDIVVELATLIADGAAEEKMTDHENSNEHESNSNEHESKSYY